LVLRGNQSALCCDLKPKKQPHIFDNCCNYNVEHTKRQRIKQSNKGFVTKREKERVVLVI